MEDKIKSDLKNAQLARDEIKVSTLRLLLSEIKNKEISNSKALPDEDIIPIIQREVKKRKEAAEAFRSGSREDAALKEESEATVLESYLPKQMSGEELIKIVSDTINEAGAAGITDIGKVIGAVMGKVRGRADGSVVSAIVKEKLSS